MPTPAAALFDVDGTLVDTNYHHAIAWARAFSRVGLTPPIWTIHRAIGMGGDHLIEAVAGARAEAEHGDELRAAWSEEYEPLLSEVHPFAGARDLLRATKERGWTLVLASSAPPEHIERYLDLLDARALIDEVTTSDDVQATKPAPDLVSVALQKVGSTRGVMIGDSTWDAVAAGQLDVATVAVRTGGFSEQELREAGAVGVYDSLTDLVADVDHTPLADPARL